MKRAIFLDRDGTINDDPGYLNAPEQFVLFPTTGKALQKLKGAGYELVIITNQSGVARGKIDPNAYPAIHGRMNELLEPYGVKIENIEMCFLHPDDPENRRKPKPDMILKMAKELDLDCSQSYMIGDRLKDVEAGLAAGCKGSLLVKTGLGAEEHTRPEADRATFIARDLLEAATWILEQESA